MSKVELYFAPVKNEIIPSMEESSRILSSVIVNLSSGPDGFASADLGRCRSSLSSIRRDLNKDIDWLKSSVSKLNKDDDRFASRISVMSVHKVSLKRNKVNY